MWQCSEQKRKPVGRWIAKYGNNLAKAGVWKKSGLSTSEIVGICATNSSEVLEDSDSAFAKIFGPGGIVLVGVDDVTLERTMVLELAGVAGVVV
jgi:hypothetical protein